MNTFTSKALLKKLHSKKKVNDFTMIELMVVAAIIGVLSSVALPALISAQDRAKSSAAKQESVNAAKTCTIALIGGDATEIGNADVAAITSGDVTTAGAACADDMAIAFESGGDTWTTTLSGGVAGTPVKS